jgi:tetratricopeptide (TPR) repeat protein
LLSLLSPLPLVLALGAPSPAAVPQAQPATPAPGRAAAPRPAAPAETFEETARKAAAPREGGRSEEALRLYRQALRQRRDWDEGLWWVATLLYERDRYAEARDAFARFLEVKPDAAPGWALRGICAFEQRDYPAAIEHLTRGLDLGLGGNAELLNTARYRLGLALLKTGQFELALQPLTLLARSAPESPGLTDALGLLLLRSPLLPSEVPEGRKELVRQAGHAGYLHLARRGEEAGKAYAALVEAYPREPWVHYAHGVFLLRGDSEKGIAELRKEIEVKPDNVMAHLEIAFELILRGDYAGARADAERAVALAPNLFASRNALGRALVELGEVEEGIRQLEEAVRLAPESPEMHFALGRAYAKAGRAEDAARARATFAELDQKRRERRVPASSGRDPRAEESRP